MFARDFGDFEPNDLPVLVDLTSLAEKLARTDERVTPDDELMATVVGIETARRFLDAAEGAALAELDARGSTDIAHGLRTSNWLAAKPASHPPPRRVV